MTEFAARISRVRMKDGSADLAIIEGWREPDEETIQASALETMREACDREDMTAFFQTIMFEDGSVWFSHRIDPGNPMARTLLPTYIAELVRRHALSKPDSQQVFESMFEWVE